MWQTPPPPYQHPSNNTNMGGLNEQPRQPLTSKIEPQPPLDTNQRYF